MTNMKILHRRTINREVLMRRIALRRKQDLERLAAMPPLNPTPPQTKSSGPATISVVGNAQSLFENKYGNIIDDADIVIRFNSGFIVDPEVQGSKTTMVIWSNLEPEDQLKYGDGVKFHNSHDFDERKYLEEKLGYRPSNGITALTHIRNVYQNSRVRIFGFDWKQTKTWYATSLNSEVHNFAIERKYCLKLIDEMGWELYR